MNQLDHFPYLSSYVSSMKVVPSGKFRYSKHQIWTKMTSFKIGVTPVTWALWKEFCNSTGFQLEDDRNQSHLDNHPALVSWVDIMGKGRFVSWASELAGFNLTLPTSAQFEYAARGGKDGQRYPWGDRFDRRLVWASDLEKGKTTGAVDRLDNIYCNGYGLTDMVGNVPQWCRDTVRMIVTRSTDPIGIERGLDRDVRGGWVIGTYKPSYFLCTWHGSHVIHDRWFPVGFRLIASTNEIQPSDIDATE